MNFIRLFPFFAIFSTQNLALGCNPTVNTWLVTENIDYTATFPEHDFQNDTFCVSTQDLSNGKVFYTTSNVVNSMTNYEQLNADSFKQHVQKCGKNDSQVQGCYSHCLDKTIEATVIQATVASNDLKVVVKQIPQLLNSNSPIVVISAQVDLSNVNGRVGYTYFDDLNFCSVFIKIKKPAKFPYAIFITVQQVL